jgi:ATP adenylyltransferase
MERIWAPWRMSYVSNTVTQHGCVFCNGWAATDDREALVLHRSGDALVMLNRYPYTGGHLLIAPARHLADPEALSDSELLDMMILMRNSLSLLRKVARPDGFNVGMNLGRAAGAGIEDHLHLHVVPRWNGDVNFMTVIGDLRIIPEGLAACYDRLRDAIGNGW